LEVATSSQVPLSDVLFSSLINVAFGYDPIGWGIPYSGSMVTDIPQQLMDISLQLLLLLLDYGHPFDYSSTPPSPQDTEQQEGQQQLSQSGQYMHPSHDIPLVQIDDVNSRGYNVYRRHIGQINRTNALNFIISGFIRLLNNVHEAQNTYLPYSITQIDCHQELLILLWKFMDESPVFIHHLIAKKSTNDLLIPLVFFMFKGKSDPSKVSLVHTCAFILLRLSGEREFCVGLNTPYMLSLPIDMPLFKGTHADLVFIMLHKMVVCDNSKLSPLYLCFLTIMANVSPYCKSLSPVSSVKLVNLFDVFTSPRFLYAAEGNHVYVSLLLDVFNNLIQYQYEGNFHLVYAILRRKEVLL